MKKIFNKKILYLTINGVLEPLGESQISNYISKLSKDYKVLYTGKNGNVAHECIIDIDLLKQVLEYQKRI